MSRKDRKKFGLRRVLEKDEKQYSNRRSSATTVWV